MEGSLLSHMHHSRHSPDAILSNCFLYFFMIRECTFVLTETRQKALRSRNVLAMTNLRNEHAIVNIQRCAFTLHHWRFAFYTLTK